MKKIILAIALAFGLATFGAYAHHGNGTPVSGDGTGSQGSFPTAPGWTCDVTGPGDTDSACGAEDGSISGTDGIWCSKDKGNAKDENPLNDTVFACKDAVDEE